MPIARTSLGVALSAALALVACNGPHRENAHHRGAREVASQRVNLPKDDPRFAAGAFAYASYCALCHGADATGYAADHAPSLVSATFLESASDEFISRSIREGRPGTAMAAYARGRGGPLDDEEVSAIVLFLRASHPIRVRLPSGAVAGDVARGKDVYANNCKACHGTPSERGFAVHLSNQGFLSTASDAFLRYAVAHGRPGTPMPAFRHALGEADMDNLVAALRSWATPQRELATRALPVEPPPLGDVVLNPSGKRPEFSLRADRFVPIDDVKRALDGKERIVIIDARAASDWFSLHIPGSISVPYYLLSRLDAVPRDDKTWVIAYCACPHHASGVVVDELRKRGYPHTAVLDEGIFAWQKRGYPVEGDSIH